MALTSRIYAVLLTLTSIVLLGASSCSKPLAEPPPSEPLADGTGQAAFFIVQREDLNGERGIDLQDYSMLVCNSGLSPNEVRAAAREDALILSYMNPHQVPLWGENVPVFERLRLIFNDDSYYWLNQDGTRTSIYPNTEELLTTPANAERYAGWAAQEFRHWEGIFVDELWGERPQWALESLPGIPPSQWAGIRAAWDEYRDHFIAVLRQQYGGIVIANVGREPERVYHLDISGITIESNFVNSASDSARFTHAFLPFPADRCVAWDWRVDSAAAVTGLTWQDLQDGNDVFADP